MKLAIIGSRGFLTKYGGYETFVKHLALGLAEKGLSLTVFGIAGYREPANDNLYPNIKRVWLPTIRVKFLEKVVSSLLAVIFTSFSYFDIVFTLGISPGLFLFLLKILGKKIVVNPDGLEWQRPKWSKFIAFWLRLSELAAIKFSDVVISDSQRIENYIKEKFKKKRVVFIPYGADINIASNKDASILQKYGLKQNQYFVQVCRLEPENNVHIIIREFNNYTGDKHLVIIGDTLYSVKYKKNLKRAANHKIKFLGAIYGQDYKVILRNGYCYIHGHEVGGTNPSLLEAMASAKCPVVLNVPYNIDVIGNDGLTFSKNEGDLKEKLEYLDKNENLVMSL